MPTIQKKKANNVTIIKATTKKIKKAKAAPSSIEAIKHAETIAHTHLSNYGE